MDRFKVLTPLDHNGKRIEPGQFVGLDEDHAAPLLAVACIEPAPPVKGKAEEKPAA